MSSPFVTEDTPLYVQIINVTNALTRALLKLAQDHGKGEADAERLLAAGLGRSIRPAWYDLAWEVVSCRKQLDELQQREKDETRAVGQAKRQATLEACPFKVGDRVLHKSGGSERKGADARVGIVKRVWAAQTRDGFAAKLSVDWPAPRRINGDGWHRSDVLATAVIPATEEEIERRRSLNRARNARLEAECAERVNRLALEAAGRVG